jgi:hypothetical protein
VDVVASASFTTGRHSFTEADIDATQAWIRTDVNGDISEWALRLTHGALVNVGDERYGLTSVSTTTSFQEYGSVQKCGPSGCPSYYTENAFAPSVGSWTVIGSPTTPLPSVGALGVTVLWVSVLAAGASFSNSRRNRG